MLNPFPISVSLVSCPHKFCTQWFIQSLIYSVALIFREEIHTLFLVIWAALTVFIYFIFVFHHSIALLELLCSTLWIQCQNLIFCSGDVEMKEMQKIRIFLFRCWIAVVVVVFSHWSHRSATYFPFWLYLVVFWFLFLSGDKLTSWNSLFFSFIFFK